MKAIRTVWILVLALSSFSSAALAADDMSAPAAAPAAPTVSLYERLGGEPAITAVVDDFVNRAAGDPAVNFVRKGTGEEWDASPENVATLKKHLTQFICSATGGSQVYQGMDMKTTHEGMQISEAEFGAIAADLKASLDKFNVPAQEQQELLTIVGTTKDSIVESTPEAAAPAAPSDSTNTSGY